MEIKISDLCFNYGRKAVLTDVNVSFPSGSLTAVLGMNGAGKTTLLKILSRLIKPRRGCILIDDDPLEKFGKRENARATGYVSQMHGTAKLRVAEYLLIGRTPYRRFRYTQKDEAIVMRVMERMGLSAFAARRTTALFFLILLLIVVPVFFVAAAPADLVTAARTQIGITRIYDPAYVKLTYPGGDVPRDRGVCTDVVGCTVPRHRPHIMIVSNRKTAAGVPYVIHNIGAGVREEARLFEFPLTGHYRMNKRTCP